MKPFKTIPIFIIFIILSSAASAKMYKWVDEKGVTHYSNTPHELPNAGVEENIETKSNKPVQKIKDGELQDNKKLKSKTTKSKTQKLSAKPTLKPEAKYNFSSWIIHNNDKIIKVSGRVDGGEPCKQLKVRVYFRSEKGLKKRIECTVNIGSYGSRVIEGSTPSNSDERKWHVTDVYTRCLD
ncbi:DUF4124 domain-containing protein [Desulfococcaceae bacterium HSG7]|nr:DUF4124 domain-containing protein [Desulfococcaceae bacterium HSG7]